MFSNSVLLEVVILTSRTRSTYRCRRLANIFSIIEFIGCSSRSSRSTRKLHCSFQRPSHKKDPKKLKIQQQPPVSGKFDLIGPPDPISNIRPIQFHVPLKETETEKSFRLRRSEILQWNQNFWAHHNSSFFKEKENYILEHQEIDSDGKTSISAEKLSVFYKRFLDENRISHLNYNREWYKQNISLLWPALKVTFIRLTRKFDRNS